jgi:hypothetical protein
MAGSSGSEDHEGDTLPMTTPQQRVRALRKAIADIQAGDLDAALDLDRFAENPDYSDWYAALEADGLDPEDEANNHARFLGHVEGVSGKMLGRVLEFHLDCIKATRER